MKFKSKYNTFIGVLLIALTLTNLLIYKIGYTYRPKNYAFFIIFFLVIIAGATVLSIKFKKYANKASRIFAYIMPIISLLYAASLLFSFDLSVNNKTYDIVYYELMCSFLMISSFILCFVYSANKWLKIFEGIVAAIIAFIFGFMVFISIIFAGFGASDILQDINSPNNTYSAVIISLDGGALGGDTLVYVRNIQKDVSLLIGKLKFERKEIWYGDWGDVPTLEWVDDNNLLINNRKYDVAEFLNTKSK